MAIGPGFEGMTSEEKDACARIIADVDAQIKAKVGRENRVLAQFRYPPGLTQDMIEEIETKYEDAGWGRAFIDEDKTFGPRAYHIELER